MQFNKGLMAEILNEFDKSARWLLMFARIFENKEHRQ